MLRRMETDSDRPNPYQPPQSNRSELTWKAEPLTFSQTPHERNAGPEGLGGWLIVIAIKLIMTLLSGCLMLMTLMAIFNGDAWSQISTPGTDAYHPLFGPLIIFELVGNIVLAGGSLTLLVMFFRKAPSFPRWMIALLVFGPILTAADMYWASLIPNAQLQATNDQVTTLTRTLASACIWVPYLLMSKRVRNTFAPRRKPSRRIEPVMQAAAAPDTGA